MESQKHYTEILAKWLLAAFVAVIAWLLFRQFGSVVVYVLLAGVVSLIAKPLKMMLAKIRIKGHRAPDWFLAILSILLILVIFCGIIAGLAPMVKEVISDVASVTGDTSLGAISSNLAELNAYLVNTFDLDPGFRIEVAILHQVKSLINVNIFGNVIGSVASALASFGIGLFSVVFIAFFFIRDEKLFSRIICALAPDRHEDEVAQSLSDVEHLLSRYFIGLIVEMSCVGLIDFLGLWAIARLELGTAIGIGFMAGLLNIIPYVGPLLGGVLGTIIAINTLLRNGSLRIGYRILGIFGHPCGYIHACPAGGQFHSATCNLLHKHSGQSAGNLHSDAPRRHNGRNPGNAHRNSGLYCCPGSGREIFPAGQVHSKAFGA